MGDTNYYASINNQGQHRIILKNKNVNFTLRDKNGNIWIATEYGLMRLFLDGFLDMDKEQLNGIWGMVEDTKGTMYFGSYYQKYLKSWDGKQLKEIALKDVSRDTIVSKYNEFKRFNFGGQRDKNGNIYFSMSWGILKYDGHNFSRLDKAMYSGRSISMFHHIDTIRNVLVSATNSGVNIINLSDGATRYYGAAKGVHPASFILGISQDPKGNYWLVSPSGVSYFDTQRDSVTKTYTRKEGNFPYYSSVCATTDDKGVVWVGSSQGLLHYDTVKDTFIVAVKNDILPRVSSLGVIKDQYLVIGTVGGVYFLDLKAFYTEGVTKLHGFNQHTGYMGIEPNQNGLYMDTQGYIWVAASDAVTRITPSELDFTNQPLIPFITQINDKRIPYTDYGKLIALNYGTQSARIRFEAVGFERPFKTEFSYKINEGKWSAWQTDEIAVIDGLAGGVYTFYVRTRPANTIAEAQYGQTTLQFKVDLPIHKAPYFPLVVVLIAASAISYFVFKKYKSDKDKKIAQQQQQADAQRRQEVELLNNEMAHRVRNNLNRMYHLLKLQSKQITNDEAKSILQDGIDRIQAMSSLHTHLSEQKGKEVLHMAHYIEALCPMLKKSYAVELPNLAFDVKIENTIILSEDMGSHVGLLVSELITNSIKHAFELQPNPHISIQLTEKGNILHLSYADNGTGMLQNAPKNDNTLGMTLIRGVAQKFNTTIHFENQNGLRASMAFDK